MTTEIQLNLPFDTQTKLEQENAKHLASLLIEQRPTNNKSWRMRNIPSNQLPSDIAMVRLAEQLSARTAKRNDARASRTKAIRLILRNLIICMFEHNWLTLPTAQSNFEDTEKGRHLWRMGLSRRVVEDAIKALTDEGLIELGCKGYLMRYGDNTKGMASNYRATPKLAEMFAEMLYADIGGWDAECYAIHPDCTDAEREHHERWAGVLAGYNDFIRQYSYALKGPMSRSFSHYPDRGGRITNNYQNLAQRRVPIRQQTLIDGQPLVEPDFSANHLRMAAFLLDETLPADPYSELVDCLDGVDRGMVKKVVTECFGATDSRQLGKLKGKFHTRYVGGSSAKYIAILDAIAERYPWTDEVFFCDVGAHLQYLEGEMALKMMAWAMAHNIPLLPVHDAYAVPAEYEVQTECSMSIVWELVMKEARQRNDLLEKARSRAPLMYELSQKKK